ncbi:MAG: hypothetical protein J4F37_05145 [Acidobacteria bacterium]|nr:hypothetical protein [Acidobacteriota bacterium]
MANLPALAVRVTVGAAVNSFLIGLGIVGGKYDARPAPAPKPSLVAGGLSAARGSDRFCMCV